MRLLKYIFLLNLLVCVLLTTGSYAAQQTCPFVKVETQRLPDLNIARAGHTIFCVNGEMTVAGGHTDGFIPTQTAEYFSNGEWHLMDMVYTHDNGLSVVLKSGKVLIAGGHDKHLGIGQTFVAEMYDPQKHQFTGFGCLDNKRSMANAIETDSGHVVIAGNWYADDAIEVFDGKKNFTFGKSVKAQRAQPYLFRTDNGDVMVIGGMNTKGVHHKTTFADRLKGDTLHIDLFETWQPTGYCSVQSDVSSISNDNEKKYAYLLPVKNTEGQQAVALVQDTLFTLLPTICPIPMKGEGGAISYYSPVVVDRKNQRGYLAGLDQQNRLYALCIEYAKSPAPLTLYHTDVLTDSCLLAPVVTPEGNLMFAGGSITDNFAPFKAVYLMHFGPHEAAVPEHSSLSQWAIPAVIMLIVAVLSVLFIIYRKRRTAASLKEEIQPADQQQMMQRIEGLIKEHKRYLDNSLKVKDIANELGLPKNIVSDCINSQKGYSFSRLINEYRVEHAKQLLQEHPAMKLSRVCTESGFSNETSFFRTFKALTGMTPKEWIMKKD